MTDETPETEPHAAEPTPITPPSPPEHSAAPPPAVFVVRPITSEEWREFLYADGFVYRIMAPKSLHTKKSPTTPDKPGLGAPDSMRVVDMEGVAHYIAPGWRVIRWKTKPGFPEVAF